MILRIRPSNVKGYLTPYRTGEDEAVDRYCASLVLAMSAYCPEFIVSGVNVNSPEVDRFTSILPKFYSCGAKTLRPVTFPTIFS